MIFVGLLAGTGVYQMAETVIEQIISAPEVDLVWVLTPTGKYRDPAFLRHPKIRHINSWVGPDSHDGTALNRERIRQAIARTLMLTRAPVEWIWLGDEDALPAENYFSELAKISYDFPVLMTGRTNNADGSRWYDWAGFQTDGHPFLIPYDDWDNPRWAATAYCSGNQHLFNRIGFELGVAYPDLRGEDPHFCRAFVAAGGRLIFRPELVCTLQKYHLKANPGYEPALPRALAQKVLDPAADSVCN